MDSKSLAQQIQNVLPINLIYTPEIKLYSRGAVMAKVQAAVDSAAQANKRLDTDSMLSYAILSHRWLGDGEPTYEEMVRYSQDRTRPRNPEGFRKLLMFCQKAQEAGYCWAWSDTCCIDKRSSVELDESIRSMFRWYRQSQLCIVHLSATSSRENLPADPWFTRGWTLQELLAPPVIRFYTSSWEPLNRDKDHVDSTEDQERTEDEPEAKCGGIPSNLTCDTVLDLDDHTIEDSVPLLQVASAYGWECASENNAEGGGEDSEEGEEDEEGVSSNNDKDDEELLKEISARTRIPLSELTDFTPGITMVREKMVWASSRETTRIEDIAYCLIGIFDVSLTIAYGEGPRAFQRLQLAIMADLSDPSFDLLFRWSGPGSSYNKLFASKPDCFTPVAVEDDNSVMLEYLGLPPDGLPTKHAYYVYTMEKSMTRGDATPTFSNSVLQIALSLYKVREHSTTAKRRFNPATMEDELENNGVEFHELELEVKELGKLVLKARDDPKVREDQSITDWRADLVIGVVDYDRELPWDDWKQWVRLDDEHMVFATWPERKYRKMLRFLREHRRYTAILLWKLGGGHYAKVETEDMICIPRPKKGWNAPQKVNIHSRYDG